MSDYDEQTKQLVKKLADIKEYIKFYTECEVKAESGADKINAYFKEHTDKNVMDWSKAGAITLVLGTVKFDDITLEKIVSGNDYDFEKAEDRMVLYPMLDAMSQGQRALLRYVDFGEMLITGVMDDTGWKEWSDYLKKNKDDSDANSVYAGIDRSMFDPAGVALISEARQIQAANGDMNGDVGKQWLALYTTKDKATGEPITADLIAQKGSSKMPTDKNTGIRMFGKTDTVNIVSTEFGYNDKLDGLYIFGKTEKADDQSKVEPTSATTDSSTAESSAADSSSKAAEKEESSSEDENKATGSVVGTGTMALSCVVSAAVGALIAFFLVRKKKGDNIAV